MGGLAEYCILELEYKYINVITTTIILLSAYIEEAESGTFCAYFISLVLYQRESIAQ